jgi:diguanylate cyclase (GGDEF)-like protein
VVLYILLVATANLCLGFGLAVYLGRRCRSAVGDPWNPGTAPGKSVDATLVGDPNLAAGVDILNSHPNKRQSAQPSADTTPDQAPDATTDTPASQTLPSAWREYAPPNKRAESSPTPQPDKSASEKAVEDLGSQVQQYREQVARAGDKLRACAEDPDATEIEAILGSLMDSTQQYINDRNQTHGILKELHQGQPEIRGIGDELQAAVERQDQQIESTSAMIEGFDYENRLEEGCREMSQKTVELTEGNDRLRETFQEVKVKLGRNQQPLREGDPESHSDPPSERSDRTVLEAELIEELLKWWNTGPDGTPQLSVAMIALDDFSGLEQQHGHEVADKILGAVGQLSESESGGQRSFFQLPKQRFLLLFPEVDTGSAANTADRLRQMIEKAHLHHDQSEIRLTVSCAVAGAASEETPDALIQRTEATLQEAKRYGSNRTFLHDGNFPAPIVPPSFSLDEKQITL